MRSFVELKYQGACIIFHQTLWRTAGDAAAGDAAGAAVPLVDAAISVYSIKEDSKKPEPIPQWLKDQIAPHLTA